MILVRLFDWLYNYKARKDQKRIIAKYHKQCNELYKQEKEAERNKEIDILYNELYKQLN